MSDTNETPKTLDEINAHLAGQEPAVTTSTSVEVPEITYETVEHPAPVNHIDEVISKVHEDQTGEVLVEKAALPNAAGLNAINSVPAGHASVVNPATGFSHNVYSWFHVNITNRLKGIIPFVDSTVTKTATVIRESAASPEYKAALSDLVKASAAISVSASIAVAEKGINSTQDLSTIALFENLVTATHNYINVLETEYKVA